MTQLIILNGPPRSGKDTLAKELCSRFGFKHVKFGDELKRMTHRLYNTPEQSADAYESLKDQPLTEFLNLSPREAYINVGEHYIKRFHGVDFFGLQLISTIKRLDRLGESVFVVSDGGCDGLTPLVNNFGAAQITVLQIYRDGFDFTNDSRSYYSLNKLATLGVKYLRVDNNSTVEEFIETSTTYLKETMPFLFKSDPTYSALVC